MTEVKAEPERKFKIGDEVRIVSLDEFAYENGGPGCPPEMRDMVGQVHKVTGYHYDGYPELGDYWFLEESLELRDPLIETPEGWMKRSQWETKQRVAAKKAARLKNRERYLEGALF